MTVITEERMSETDRRFQFVRNYEVAIDPECAATLMAKVFCADENPTIVVNPMRGICLTGWDPFEGTYTVRLTWARI